MLVEKLGEPADIRCGALSGVGNSNLGGRIWEGVAPSCLGASGGSPWEILKF